MSDSNGERKTNKKESKQVVKEEKAIWRQRERERRMRTRRDLAWEFVKTAGE
jgi:hypothetical protein